MKRAFLHLYPKSHHSHGEVMSFGKGLERHGWSVSAGKEHDYRDEKLVVQWGIRADGPAKAARRLGGEAVILETSYIEPRRDYCSVGFVGVDVGLNRRLCHYGPFHDGRRLDRLTPNGWSCWRESLPGGYALIMGQCPGDMALKGCENFFLWVRDVHRQLKDRFPVRFRPHPNMDGRGMVARRDRMRKMWKTCVHKDEFDIWHPWFEALDEGLPVDFDREPLKDAFAGASHVVTYNSNSGVDAVLAGIPAVTMDKGAMAWDVTSHYPCHIVQKDRLLWARALAWMQWTREEMESGECWEHVAPQGLRY